MFGRLADAALAYLHTLARGQNHVDQGDFTELFKYLPRFIAESALMAAGGQRLPQHIGQKTNQDVCAHAMLAVVPYRSDLQVRLVHAKGGLGFRELHVGAPQLLRRPVDHVAAQQVATFTPARPLPPTLHLRVFGALQDEGAEARRNFRTKFDTTITKNFFVIDFHDSVVTIVSRAEIEATGS